MLEFCVLKIVHRVAKRGIEMRTVFQKWDRDHNGVLDAEEIMKGVKSILGVDFSREEGQLMLRYLDKDRDGSITYEEFAEKISYFDYEKKSERYLISLKPLTDHLLNEWYT